MMETSPESVQQNERLSPPSVPDAEQHFAADYLVALLSARIQARKKSESEPSDTPVQMERTTER